MQIKELIKILEQTNGNGDVYIMGFDDSGSTITTKNIGYSYDDNNDIELYQIPEE